MSIKDVQLIYKIKNILGVGVVGFRIRKGISMVYLRVRKKHHLIANFVLPIFYNYPLFSNKQYDYLRLRHAILSNLVFYDDIPQYIRPTSESLNSIESIGINAPYFSAWLIGFIEAESCFSVYIQKGDYLVCFYITQTNGEILIGAIRKYLSLTPKIYKDKTNNFKKVSSVRSIENVIRFINKAPVKLLGYKKLQYLLLIAKKLRCK